MPKYTLDNFKVDTSNELAYAVAEAVTKKPLSYNPVFLYGKSGSGKTHLLRAIENEIKKFDSESSVLYMTCESLVSDSFSIIHSAQQRDWFSFLKEKYKIYTTLIVDDVCYLRNKPETQRTIADFFCWFWSGGRQLVFSSSCKPEFLPLISRRVEYGSESSFITETDWRKDSRDTMVGFADRPTGRQALPL